MYVFNIFNKIINKTTFLQVKLVFPKTAKNKDDKWLFVVNDGQYTQGVRIEICIK
jgi:hypothetical protein